MPYDGTKYVRFVGESIDARAAVLQDADKLIEKCPISNTVESGAASGLTGQVLVGTNPTLIRVRNECRRAIKITNLGTVDVFISFSPSVNILSGDLLLGTKGSFIVIPSTLDIYGVVDTTPQTVSFMELSD